MFQYPSIFNDVFGPVMRGASSSHVAGAVRIGLLSKQLLQGDLTKAVAEFDQKGSLATTYDGHGSDIGLAGGLLGFDPADQGVPKSLEIAKDKGIEIKFEITDYEADHPNTYKLTLYTENEFIKITAVSIGGGMVELIEFNGFEISIKGDFYESLILIKDVKENEFKEILAEIKAKISDYEFIDCTNKGNNYLINVKRAEELSDETINQISQINGVSNVQSLSPVLPVMSRKNIKVPFKTIDQMIETASEKNLDMWELATLYESARGNMPESEVYEKMQEIVELMETSIKKGLAGTEYNDRILGPQAWMVKKEAENNNLIPTTILNNVISKTMAVMEAKSSMELIVAAPTGGACGVIPGAVIGVSDSLNLNKEKIIKAMFSAAIIGIFISEQATFAGEEGGCQAECGSGSGMAAAGLVQLLGGDVQTALNAASIALQNIMGLICDPIANRVEAPCLGRNVMAASNAIISANMALAGVDSVIPLSEVIDTMYSVSKMMPCELRCTGLGGLSVTKTAKRIEEKLKEDKSI